jgi:hypothetical protein
VGRLRLLCAWGWWGPSVEEKQWKVRLGAERKKRARGRSCGGKYYSVSSSSVSGCIMASKRIGSVCGYVGVCVETPEFQCRQCVKGQLGAVVQIK